MRIVDDNLVSAYLQVRRNLLEMGYDEEMEWQANIEFDAIVESDFIREAAWVILSCGMKESVIRSKWIDLSEAFLSWNSCSLIVNNATKCRRNALDIFAHVGKIDAILHLASHIAVTGFPVLKAKLKHEGISTLQTFPYLGPATSYHLAKNIGLLVAKPDRHLTRIAIGNGYSSVHELCEAISNRTGDKVPVVDLILWRFASLKKDYLKVLVRHGNPVRA